MQSDHTSKAWGASMVETLSFYLSLHPEQGTRAAGAVCAQPAPQLKVLSVMRAGPVWDEPEAGASTPVSNSQSCQLQPLVPPQVLHFMQVPLRTSV